MTNLTDHPIQERIEARVYAEQLLALAETDLAHRPPNYLNAFWHNLARLAAEKLGKVVSDPSERDTPMSEEEATHFRRKSVPPVYAKYAGEEVGDVPDWYWTSVSDTTPFKRQLARYLASHYYKRTRR
jgi:hypothetical protein